MQEFLRQIKQRWQFVMFTILIVASATFAVSAFLPARYQTDMSMLVIQKQPVDKIDAFSAAKSAEYLSDIFAKVIYTDSFIDEVLKSPMDIKTKFSNVREDRKKEWSKAVEVRKVNNTGILKVSVYDVSKKEADKIAQAICWNLSTNGNKYHGGGDKVSITTIDGPITSINPTSPNIWLNTVLGVIAGLGISLSLLYFFGDSMFPEKKLPEKKDDSELQELIKRFK